MFLWSSDCKCYLCSCEIHSLCFSDRVIARSMSIIVGIQHTSKIKLPFLFFRFISCISLTEWWQGAQTTKMLRWRHEGWGCTSHKKHVSWAESSYHGELLPHIGGTLIVRKPFRFVPWTSQKLHSTIVEDYWSGLLLGLFVGQIIAQSRKAHLCPTGHVEVPRIEWELVEMQIQLGLKTSLIKVLGCSIRKPFFFNKIINL